MVARRVRGGEAAGQARLLLDLGTAGATVHVMEQTTWRNPAVRAELFLHYLPLRADADARWISPARYQDYGWPATIVFDGSGRELWKHRGYVPPVADGRSAGALARDPQPLAAEPEPPAAGGSGCSPSRCGAQLVARQISFYDRERRRLGQCAQVPRRRCARMAAALGPQWRRRRAATARADAGRRAETDRPGVGGAFQYSDSGDWDHRTSRKIMSRQFADLRGYALAYGAFGDAANLQARRPCAATCRRSCAARTARSMQPGRRREAG